MLKVLSPAKVNLGLWILRKRPDGYHDIFTVYHAVSLFDEITIKEGPLSVQTSTNIPQEENIVYKALKIMERLLDRDLEFSVYIKKNIPQGAGLGGGSSNCATVLKAVNSLLGEPLTLDELKDIARMVSSDAPFFFHCGTAVGREKGDLIEKIEDLSLKLTIIYPNINVPTSKVYGMVNETSLTYDLEDDKIVSSLIEGNFKVLENKLGDIAMSTFPQIGEVYRFLKSLGYSPLVSGSGSCVFYIGESSKEVQEGARLRGWKVYRVESYNGV
ncbi:MAG: 4-(cytidine 5'-diphospho)-2-C-methyl-D-erythritol kinase [Aquificaceae bacterium]